MLKYPAYIIWRIIVFLWVLIFQILAIIFTYFAQVCNKLWDWKEPWWNIQWKDFYFKWGHFENLSGTYHKYYYQNPLQALLGDVQYS